MICTEQQPNYGNGGDIENEIEQQPNPSYHGSQKNTNWVKHKENENHWTMLYGAGLFFRYWLILTLQRNYQQCLYQKDFDYDHVSPDTTAHVRHWRHFCIE